jgi:hypothetical protein
MNFLRRGCLGFCLLLFSVAASAQPSPTAMITFSIDFPGSIPEHYRLEIRPTGLCHYESSGRLSPEVDYQESYAADVVLSAAGRARMFDLAAQAHYFEGEIDYRKRRLANTGAKTLSYSDGQRNTRASYNYSEIVPVQQLTQQIQRIATTLEFGRRLLYYHRYQRLALEDELKRMEEMARGNTLEEVQAVAPMLAKIAADATVLNVSRVRAQRLLARAAAATPGN